jgi:hypothetical protein
MKKIVLFLAISILTIDANSQNENKIEALKREYLIKNLELTPQESEKFFPLYREYEIKKKNLRKSLRNDLKGVEHDGNSASMDKIMHQEQEILDVQKEYVQKFRQFLPEQKILKLLSVEKEFKKMLLEKLKD